MELGGGTGSAPVQPPFDALRHRNGARERLGDGAHRQRCAGELVERDLPLVDRFAAIGGAAAVRRRLGRDAAAIRATLCVLPTDAQLHEDVVCADGYGLSSNAVMYK